MRVWHYLLILTQTDLFISFLLNLNAYSNIQQTLPLEVAAHIWDIYLYEGEMYLMCVALGILKMYAPRLSTFTLEKVSTFLLHLPEDIKPEELFHNIAQVRARAREVCVE